MAKKAHATGRSSKTASGHPAKAAAHVKTAHHLAAAMRHKSHPRMRK